MKKDKRGGSGRGQGLKPGTKHKNAVKKPSERHVVKKQVSYTPEEFKRVSEAMTRREYKNYSVFGRDATLKLTEEILTDDGSSAG